MRALLYFFAVCLAFPPGCSGAEKQMETAPYIVEEIRGRKAYIVIPKAVLPEKGFPAAILLHGRGQTAGAWFGEGLLSNGDQKLFPPLLLENGIAVIAPDALEPFGKGIKQWNFFRTTTETSQDLVLFNDLFQWIRENKRIKFDLSRIYVIGISSGGFMASRLAHASPENWAGIVIVAAGDADSFPKIPSFPLDNKPLSREIA
ncbi:alpha/beta fold hydrolase, partial [Candidatus Sumerlaeota bacterium]|nr:alpha/beta fold hydrolase [Candidatus Sumerlaeota bacterium]